MVVLQDTFIAQILAHFNTTAAYWKQVVAAIVVLQDTFRALILAHFNIIVA